MSILFNRSDSLEQPKKKHGCLWTIIVCLVFYVVFCGLMGLMFEDMLSGKVSLEENSVYVLDMRGTLVEQGEEDNPFAELMGDIPGLSGQEIKVGLDDIRHNLSLAKNDSRIRGVLLRGGDMVMGQASAKAFRDALLDYKGSGKFLLSYADNYSQTNYYVASVADQVMINPVGSLGWGGMTAQKLYFKRLLDKIGVDMQIIKVGSFKAAVEPYCHTEMSEADRAQTLQFVTRAWDVLKQGVAQARHINPDSLDVYADRYMNLFPAEEYIRCGLVDSLIYRDQLENLIREYMGTKDFHKMTTSNLASIDLDDANDSSDKKIAVLYAEGNINDEGAEGIVTKKMLKQIAKIAKDDEVKGVVFRVNSPGGSANASEAIWHGIVSLQEKGIPVVVSMGDYAASGGYYISCSADYIFAEPNTLTGSIGIFGLVPNMGKLRDKIGVDIDGISTHRHSAMPVTMVYNGMNDEETAMMQNLVNRGYELFTSRCANGRHMSQDSIKQIGEGRIWIGTDAKEIGLVDEIGGIQQAIEKTASLAALTQYEVVYYPEKKDFMTAFMETLEKTTEEEKLLLRFKQLCSEPRLMMQMDEIIMQ